MNGAYYNEIDAYAAQWLRNLIAAGHIAPGEVDERSIEDVCPDDLRGFTQCHFFAGVGVWSYALRRAGWPDDRPVWTGSCPCQPFSAAGKGGGFADERHLWPAFHHLINERRPPAVFGEQVASKDADTWIDLVQTDMEALGYAFGAVPFPSAGIGAPHIRDRLYWLADSESYGHQRAGEFSKSPGGHGIAHGGAIGGLAHPNLSEPEQFARERARPGETQGTGAHDQFNGRSKLVEGQSEPGPVNGHWRDADWLFCRDGKWRPVEPGTFPLVNGAPARVGRLRAYGNAINASQAQIFIEAFRDYQSGEDLA